MFAFFLYLLMVGVAGELVDPLRCRRILRRRDRAGSTGQGVATVGSRTRIVNNTILKSGNIETNMQYIYMKYSDWLM